MKFDGRRWAVLLVFSLLPPGYLEAIRWIAGAPLTAAGLAERWGFCLVIYLLAFIFLPRQMNKFRWCLPWPGVLLAGLGISVGIVYALTSSTWVGWGCLAMIFTLFFGLDAIFTPPPSQGTSIANRGKRISGTLLRGTIHITFALVAGGLVVLITQVEAHFAEEEFFTAVQALALAGYWIMLRVSGSAAQRKLFPREGLPTVSGGLPIDTRWLAPGLALATLAIAVLAIRSYQRSFYPTSAPSYPGISAENPFLCGETTPDPSTYDGEEVFRGILSLVEANPTKAAPEVGMLALGTGEVRWAEAFRQSLLDEARRDLFTGAAGSVKSTQHEAALRVYYYPRVRDAFPGLFTSSEQQVLQDWFASINHRALTVEWVDWLYALALGKRPAGPYENQESGAGLLALLEAEGLADPALSSRNRQYLARNPRGWVARFRVTDDAAVYQPEWITNAYFQSLYTGQAPQGNLQRSFEWLLLQSIPDGKPLQYNHVGAASMDRMAYLGAELLGEDQYVWLAGRAVEYSQAQGTYRVAQPGLEDGIDQIGHSPTVGSCLLYGDSGLPTQVGPLAPDKIVFRSGWAEDAVYLLLDLRFTGWHRYKATNTISLIYQNGSLAAEDLNRSQSAWLPTGRSLFRDKRVPRENLNGLVIGRTGLSAGLYTLTGIGGPWAQDPPYYANVERFDSGPEMDVSTTVIEDWHGWTHRRTIYFYHDGLVVVMDEASGSQNQPAALVWHLPESATLSGQRILLRDGKAPAEVVVLPSQGQIQFVSDESGTQVRVVGNGSLVLATIFLTNGWAGAQVAVTPSHITITGERTVVIPTEER